ncbi:MAG: L-lysine 2,3-aminomutase [Berkelbacteria bacterium GW2011_GWA1_36_9]|uniref:L-lysine 2,3-aminomutase n=1 Tax=Berkelbacteria bacterium GW2011_GWA1_36_9 TaxID=1618331 RepID=A0A0G0FJ06_9BACT|nr:MAG: L-lysine 2,3-aminomutase [Berkelbacteria bacterium GW2011_GWA1_36_9]
MVQKIQKNWQNQLKKGISSIDELSRAFDQIGVKKSDEFYKKLEKVNKKYPIFISPYLFKQCLRSKAVYKQFIPNNKELINLVGENDPLNEDKKKTTGKLIHMYPDRALLLATDMCFSSCRFCTRKRIKKLCKRITLKQLDDACKYIAKNKQIKDVIISGGDPLTIKDSDLRLIIERIKKIRTIKIIRIGTRAPISNPGRITDNLVGMLKKFTPLYINIHINHPDEFTQEVIKVLRKLSGAGIILGSQSVLLKGVNDNSKTIKELLYKCVENGIRPYYLYQCDEVSGTEHFWTDYQQMFKIAQNLIGNISGLAIPNFAFDCKGGYGKVRVIPEFYKHKNEKGITFKTFKNKLYTYKNLNNKK